MTRLRACSPTLAFDLDIGPNGLHANAPTFDRAEAARVLAAIVPEAVGATAANNRIGWLRANPWN